MLGVLQSWCLGQNLRDRDETLTLRDRDETKTLSKNSRRDIFDTKFWKFGELPNTLQYRFLGISLLYYRNKLIKKVILLKRYTFVFN